MPWSALPGIDVDALVGFEVEHVSNLDPKAKEGFGDKVADYDSFDLGVRQELVGNEAKRIGGGGSFDDLVARLKAKKDDPDAVGAPDEDGWGPESATPAEYGFDDGDPDDESVESINPFTYDAGEK